MRLRLVALRWRLADVGTDHAVRFVEEPVAATKSKLGNATGRREPRRAGPRLEARHVRSPKGLPVVTSDEPSTGTPALQAVEVDRRGDDRVPAGDAAEAYKARSGSLR
jgi:hypothetical protein